MAASSNLGGARPGAGRPKLPKSQQKSARITVWMTPTEKAQCKKRSKSAKLELKDWARAKLLS
jgi:hypothetical protein